jgi:glycosyltransferase involved in cell wall biosynthesis
LASLDVLVLSSHMEASPVSLLEGLACGKPVVATNVGSISETVRHGEHGYLVPPGDADALAANVARLFNNPQLAQQMGAAGREHVIRECSLERMVAGYEELLTEIYRSKCAGRGRTDAAVQSESAAISAR